MQVLQRLLPLHRGLFEDYVANFWCTTHSLVKWRRLFSQPALVRACTLATLAALLPAALQQVLRPSPKGFLFCLLNSSMAFYLFSYQVRFSWLGLLVLSGFLFSQSVIVCWCRCAFPSCWRWSLDLFS